MPLQFVFAANDGVTGTELWVSDGTAAGTQRLTDIRPGAAGAAIYDFVGIDGDRALFSANDGSTGSELWITDGTTGGTQLVRDIRPGASGSLFGLEGGSLADGRVVFEANDGSTGFELWVTDGSTAGTVLLRDVDPGAASGNPAHFDALGDGRLVFSADGGAAGNGLWVTDGTTSGTSFVEFFYSALGGYGDLAGSGRLPDGRIVFNADGPGPLPDNNEELWITDGTAAGTFLLKEIDENTYQPDSDPAGFTPLPDGRLLFTANDGYFFNRDLWVTDGTTAGTVKVKDFSPSGSYGDPSAQAVYDFGPGGTLGDGRIVFGAGEGLDGFGRELWVTDGTAAGTVLLQDIANGPADSRPMHFTPLGDGRVLFSASTAASGTEAWITDGTAAGTHLIRDIKPGSGSGLTGIEFTALGDGRAVFTANDGVTGNEMWITDGTFAGTIRLSDINAGAGSGVSTSVDVFVLSPPNAPPVVDAGIADRAIGEVVPFSFLIDADAFFDSNGDVLVFSARLVGGNALPAWLSFNATTGEFSGVAGNRDAGTLQIEVTATDPDGAAAVDVFELVVADNGTGIGAPEKFSGSIGDDVLFGGGGGDFIKGIQGSDTLFGQAGDDTLDGGSGGDSLVGGADDDILRGSNGRDTLLGGAGNDTLAGGAGNDLLIGGPGADLYRFDIPSDGVDTILGFDSAADEIQLSRDNFGGLALGAIAAARFQASASAVAEANAVRFVYQTTTGRLFYDADGAGGAAGTLLAVLDQAPTLTASDIVLIA